jgi:3-deoxy-8-phosphooctulonate synthase
MFKLIAGPCVIESEELVLQVADRMSEIIKDLPVEYYFKASFDKANRTSVNSYRGPGMEKGLAILANVKKRYGFRILTDIHEPAQAAPVAEVADVLQIPAFLCRQTDLLVAAGRTGKPVNVKKGQFLAADDMKNVIQKIESTGNHNIWLSERGTSFGYHTLVVDMTGIVEMKKSGYPVIMDATHSVQKPGGNGATTGGSREYVAPLAKAAAAAGADGLFLEVHPDPDHALSDGPNMLALGDVRGLTDKVLQIYNIVRT